MSELTEWEIHTCDGKPTPRCQACWAQAYKPLEAYRAANTRLQSAFDELLRDVQELRGYIANRRGWSLSEESMIDWCDSAIEKAAAIKQPTSTEGERT